MTFVFFFFAVVFFVVSVVLTEKLKEGFEEYKSGKRRYDKFNNFFVRLFARSKLAAGRMKLLDGEKKISFWKKVRFACVLIAILCVVCSVLSLIIVLVF